MNSNMLRLARGAVRICAAYRCEAEKRLDTVDRKIGKIAGELDLLNRIRRRLMICRHRGWTAAAKEQFNQLRCTIRDLHEEADNCLSAIDRAEKHAPVPRHFLDELKQIEDEFGEVGFDSEHPEICVVTEPIVLEDLPLGRFEIGVRVRPGEDIDPTNWIRIAALDPNPAASNESVTHPHIRDERLCAGDASAALNQALIEGRLCDALLLIRSVLRNYNAESPYVPLTSWNGHSCYDCGYSMDEDESHYCEGCEHDLCDDCYSFCRSCDEFRCRACLAPCPLCEDLCCGSCFSGCTRCQKQCCPSCLDENLCTDCQPKGENDDPSTSQSCDHGCPQAGINQSSPQAA